MNVVDVTAVCTFALILTVSAFFVGKSFSETQICREAKQYERDIRLSGCENYYDSK
jgi:hypothetical protein